MDNYFCLLKTNVLPRGVFSFYEGFTNCHLYHYAGNNPVRYVDPDGRDVIILNRSYGAGGFGHNAIMIGNDDFGWSFFSKDDIGKNTYAIYPTFLSFFIDNKNLPLAERYDRCCVIHTTLEEDKKMVIQGLHIYERDYAFAEHETKDGLIVQNCADLVADIVTVNERLIISKPKIENGSTTRRAPYIWRFLGVDILFKKGVVSPINTEVTWPNKQFEDFSNENSGGIIELPQ